jgi:uncharacterized protein (TIGR00661 family)
MNFIEVNQKRILIACNDWGWGHLSRSIAIIRKLLSQNNEIEIACNEAQKKVFLTYFPTIKAHHLDGYNWNFSGSGKWTMEMLQNAKNLLVTIGKEKLFIEEITKINRYDLILSDHRYGFRSKTIPSIFITHQVHLPVSRISSWVSQTWHKKQLKAFNSLWIIDTPESTFAGKLSENSFHPTSFYIGVQSRFEKKETITDEYTLAIISGPEPYSTQLLEEVIIFARKQDHNIKCITSLDIVPTHLPENIEIIHATNWLEIDTLFYNCKDLISRSGYSTLLDLAILEKPALLIPTPGQPEQLYLANKHKNNYFSWIFKQNLL